MTHLRLGQARLGILQRLQVLVGGVLEGALHSLDVVQLGAQFAYESALLPILLLQLRDLNVGIRP